jgi:hypothetical protein
MAHVCDVPDVSDLVADMQQVTEKQIEGNGRPGMTQVSITIHRRTADIHPDMILVDGNKKLFLAGQGVVQC